VVDIDALQLNVNNIPDFSETTLKVFLAGVFWKTTNVDFIRLHSGK